MSFEKMTRRITLRQMAQGVNAAHEVITTVAVEYEVWAEFRGMAGKERFAASQEVASGAGVFVVRYLSGVDATWEIEDWLGRKWDVIGEPVPIGLNEYMEIPAEFRGEDA